MVLLGSSLSFDFFLYLDVDEINEIICILTSVQNSSIPHHADSPIATPKSTISTKTSLGLLGNSAQSSPESDNQTSEDAVRACPRHAYGRKIRGWGTRGVLLASGLGRVRNNRADAAKESQWCLFTSHESVTIQLDSPTSPLSIVETFVTSEHVDSIVDFINNYANIMMNDRHIQVKNRSVFNQWKNSNRDEMWLFLLLFIVW